MDPTSSTDLAPQQRDSLFASNEFVGTDSEPGVVPSLHCSASTDSKLLLGLRGSTADVGANLRLGCGALGFLELLGSL